MQWYAMFLKMAHSNTSCGKAYTDDVFPLFISHCLLSIQHSLTPLFIKFGGPSKCVSVCQEGEGFVQYSDAHT